MARSGSSNRDKTFELYKNSTVNIRLKDIDKELNIKGSQIRKLKSQGKWDDKLNERY